MTNTNITTNTQRKLSFKIIEKEITVIEKWIETEYGNIRVLDLMDTLDILNENGMVAILPTSNKCMLNIRDMLLDMKMITDSLWGKGIYSRAIRGFQEGYEEIESVIYVNR